jgi:uncharacterized membrane protein HdeD (DUF308 family)
MANKKRAAKAAGDSKFRTLLLVATLVVLVGGAVVYAAYAGAPMGLALDIFFIGAVVIVAGIAAIVTWVMWMSRGRRGR